MIEAARTQRKPQHFHRADQIIMEKGAPADALPEVKPPPRVVCLAGFPDWGIRRIVDKRIPVGTIAHLEGSRLNAERL